MSLSIDEKTPRREFLGQLALSAVAIAGTACAPAATATHTAPAPQHAAPAAPAPATPAAPAKWDDSWTARITGKHKGVFDCPEIGEGALVGQAYNYYASMKQVYDISDAEISAVLVIRHAAIPLALDDEMWAKYEIGKMEKYKDPVTKKWATKNPFYKASPEQKGMAPYTLDAFIQRGAILMGCNLAFMGMASQIAQQSGQERNGVRDELKAHLLPGLTLAPNGIFAVMRAQEAGCSYIRST